MSAQGSFGQKGEADMYKTPDIYARYSIQQATRARQIGSGRWPFCAEKNPIFFHFFSVMSRNYTENFTRKKRAGYAK